jgi:hypothetical protein
MPHGFDDYRVFVSAPGDLDRDRQACYDAISDVNEKTAMPAKVLLVSVGLRENNQVEGHRGIVADNIRWSSYFIQLFEDDWGPRDVFRKLFMVALECKDDPNMPMRDVVVCLKDSHETDAQILAFRAELESRSDVRLVRYSRPEEIRDSIAEIGTGWAESIIGAMSPVIPE